ncbi:MAG: transposase [Mycobacteriales bacterium]
MTIARAHLVDPAVSRWYHCLTRCVRRAFLLGEGTEDRKVWIERRLQELAEIFAVSVAGFSVMDNHLHVLVRLDPDVAAGWSDEDVVRRWGRLFPPRDKARRPLPVSEEWVQGHLLNPAWVTRARQRLQSLSWFMKCLKEPLARLANHQDKTRGAFFEGRFKSIAILDETALLTTCAYIDLNPVAAGIAEVPESSTHTSLKARVDHVKDQGRTEDLNPARSGSVAGSAAAAGLEEGHWLCPVEDRRRIDSGREGMIEGFSLGNYVLLVDYTARLYREGKATLSREVAEILDRLGSSVDHWQARLEKLRQGQLLGRFFAASRQRLRQVAERLGLKRVPNLGGCPAS